MPDLARQPLRPAMILVATVTLARLLYLAFFCPYTLVEDEAWYWLWSRHLEWSYVSKGPGIAWLIRLSTIVLSDTAFAVRMPSVLCSGLTALTLAALAARLSANPRAPLFTAACSFLAPLFQVTGLLMTIDGPYLLCWALAMLAAHAALTRASALAWGAFAAAVGAGFLFKYTILLLPPGVASVAYVHRARLPRPRRPLVCAVACTAVAAVGLAPVLIWNARHAWATVAHLADHLHVSAQTRAPEPWRYSPLWTLEYLAVQIALAGPALFIAIRALRRPRPERDGDATLPAHALLAWMALPLLLFYFVVSFRTHTQANWAAAAHLSTVTLAGLFLAHALPADRIAMHLWRATLIVGIALAIITPRLDLLARALDALATLPAVQARVPTWLYIPTHRFTGADAAGRRASELLGDLRARTGLEPFILTDHYGPASLLEFYTPGHPAAYCASAFVPGGRVTQFDMWDHSNLRAASRLLGRPALIVGPGGPGENNAALWRAAFTSIEPIPPLEPASRKRRPAFLGYGFRGIPGTPIASPREP